MRNLSGNEFRKNEQFFVKNFVCIYLIGEKIKSYFLPNDCKINNTF